MTDRKNKIKKIWYFLTLLPAVLSAVFMMFMVNSLAIEGKQLGELEQKIHTYKIENKQLKYQSAQLGAISTLSKRANDLGLKPAVVSFVDIATPKLASSN